MYIDRRKIEKLLRQWKKASHIEPESILLYKITGSVLNVYTSRPGYLIGYHGTLIRKYISKASKYGVSNIKLVEVDGRPI